jgi:hypothetical protein
MSNIVHQESEEDFPKRHYQRLLKHIRKLKTVRENKENLLRDARTYLAGSVSPFILKLTEIKLEVLKMLNKSYQNGFFTFWEKTKLHDLILQRAHELSFRHQSSEAENIYQQYQKNAPDQGIKDLAQFSETLFKSFWGEVLDSYSYQNIDNKQDKSKIEISNEEENHQTATDTEQKITQTLKNLYTRLAKKLHPDLEADETKKVEKNELMQRITEAYKKNDIITLLDISAQYDWHEAEDFEEKDLAYFIILLKKQVKNLEREIARFENEEDETIYFAFCSGGRVDYSAIDAQKDLILEECGRIKEDLELFSSEYSLRSFLRRIEF